VVVLILGKELIPFFKPGGIGRRRGKEGHAVA
jgi:hypothetical protein